MEEVKNGDDDKCWDYDEMSSCTSAIGEEGDGKEGTGGWKLVWKGKTSENMD